MGFRIDTGNISRTHFLRSYFHPERNEFCPQRRAVSTGQTLHGHRRGIRGAVPDALLRPLSLMGRDSSPASGDEESAVSLPFQKEQEREGVGVAVFPVQFRNSASGMRPEDSRAGLRPGAFNEL